MGGRREERKYEDKDFPASKKIYSGTGRYVSFGGGGRRHPIFLSFFADLRYRKKIGVESCSGLLLRGPEISFFCLTFRVYPFFYLTVKKFFLIPLLGKKKILLQ